MSRVSAAAANRNFSKVLRQVREGRTIVVTSHGRPVARLVPFEGDSSTSNAARRALLTRLQKEPVVQAGRWTRESLYRDVE